MTAVGGEDALSPGSGTSRRFRLDVAVADMYADMGVTPLLRRLLAHSRGLLDTVAGSFSWVDATRGSYAKLAEYGVSCRLGSSFSLDQGATGRAFAGRRPVVIENYGDLRVSHLPRSHPASRGAAAAVPLWWRGEVIGVNVAFAGSRRRFTTAELDTFELLSQSAAGAIIRAGVSEPSLARLIRERSWTATHASRVQMVVTEVGEVRPVCRAVASTVVELVSGLGHTAALRDSSTRLRVALVYRQEGLRLLVQDETAEVGLPAAEDPLGMGTRSWHELLSMAAGAVEVEPVPGWGTLLRADIPYAPEGAATELPVPSPLTKREDQVLHLLAGGLSDREMAAQLVVSPKTVEKHVGAVLRKSGAASRTAAVMRAMERGWLPANSAVEGHHGR